MEEKFLTPEGLEKIKQELNELKTVKRPALIKRIQEAKELGDLSENADYQSAKEEQSFVEGKIMELENIIKNATVVKKKKNNSVVGINCAVTIKDKNNREFTYTITGSDEADPSQGKISHESPIGEALMGKKAGGEISIKTPNGEIKKFKIIKIE